MVLNKFQVQIENIGTSEILGSNYGCKKCSTNKVDIIKSQKKSKTTKNNKTYKTPKTYETYKIKKTKKNKLLFVNKILFILMMVIIIFSFTFNNNMLNYFDFNMINDKINCIKVFILTKINLHAKNLK
jgi:zona occludens toxin (predicted ATPase)